MSISTKYESQYCEMVIDHFAQGYSFVSFGAKINVSRETLNDWISSFDDFKEAVSIGKAKSLYYYESIGIRACCGEIKNFNTSAWMFMMKNLHGWSNEPKQEKDIQPISIQFVHYRDDESKEKAV